MGAGRRWRCRIAGSALFDLYQINMPRLAKFQEQGDLRGSGCRWRRGWIPAHVRGVNVCTARGTVAIQVSMQSSCDRHQKCVRPRPATYRTFTPRTWRVSTRAATDTIREDRLFLNFAAGHVDLVQVEQHGIRRVRSATSGRTHTPAYIRHRRNGPFYTGQGFALRCRTSVAVVSAGQ